MKSTLILSVIGPDRPGIVDDLSSVIIDNNGNWLESRMCNLAGQFAGILLVECSSDSQDGLMTALKNLEKSNLKVQMTLGGNGQNVSPRASIELEITGPDHPGIVHDISHFLAERDINILEMVSHCEEGAMSGGYVFHSNISASIPQPHSISDVEDALDGLANSLNVDITLDDLKGSRTRI